VTHSDLLGRAAGLADDQRVSITAGAARALVATLERVLDQRDELRTRLRAATDDLARLAPPTASPSPSAHDANAKENR
jgi:hypothetical protein